MTAIRLRLSLRPFAGCQWPSLFATAATSASKSARIPANSGLLADQQCMRHLRALAKNGSFRTLEQAAALAPGRGLCQGRQVERLQKAINGSRRLVSGSDRATSAALVIIHWPSGLGCRDSPRTRSDELLDQSEDARRRRGALPNCPPTRVVAPREKGAIPAPLHRLFDGNHRTTVRRPPSSWPP